MSGLSGQRNIQLLLAKQVQALAENGLHYSENDYDLDRYTNLEKVAIHMISLITGMSNETIQMLNERADLLWSLPGGWCDVGYTPSEIAEKEAREEAGIDVKAGRLLAVFDKKCHDHPEDLFYAYKIFWSVKLKAITLPQEWRPWMWASSHKTGCPNYPPPETQRDR